MNKQHKIYFGRNLLWCAYYDPNRENTIIEIGGTKLARYDELYPTNKKDVIARNETSSLFYQDGKLYYKNVAMSIPKINLRLIDYTDIVDQRRQRFFEAILCRSTSEYEELNNYAFENEIINKVFAEFRDNMHLPLDCMDYLILFYRKLVEETLVPPRPTSFATRMDGQNPNG